MESLKPELSQIRDNIQNIKNEIKNNKIVDDAILIAATKTVDPDRINFAIDNGIAHIGENRVQELVDKYDSINKDVTFHFIGHLQKNKVKYIIDKVKYIHSLDSIDLAAEINKRAEKIGIVMNVLIQINICKEESKSGILLEDFESFYNEVSGFNNICVCGIMAIPEVGCDKKYFIALSELFNKYKNNNFKFLSMGMSNDYITALQCGSNAVRIGRGIFGERI